MARKLLIKDFVAFITKMQAETAGYIMGSYGQNPRTGYLDLSITECKSAWKPTGWYYSQYTNASQHEKALYWRNHSKRVFDCQGLSEGYYEIITGTSVNTYARNNYATWCDPKGSGLIPVKYRVPGAAVFWGDSASSIHHIGYLEKPVKEGHPEGDWYIIEARGVKYGVVRTTLNERKPNYWGWMTKYYEYDTSADEPAAPAVKIKDTLRNGSKGDLVKELQSTLIELGYDCGKWGCDGDFGDATEIAVKKFQKDNNLTADGVIGAKTWAALEEKMNKEMTPVFEPKTVEIVNGSCYVRTKPNTSGDPLGVVKAGTKLEYLGETDENTGWHEVKYNDKRGWVSCKYSKLV